MKQETDLFGFMARILVPEVYLGDFSTIPDSKSKISSPLFKFLFTLQN